MSWQSVDATDAVAREDLDGGTAPVGACFIRNCCELRPPPSTHCKFEGASQVCPVNDPTARGRATQFIDRCI